MRIAIACYPTHGVSGVVASELALGLAEGDHEIHTAGYAVPFRLRSFHPNVLTFSRTKRSYAGFE